MLGEGIMRSRLFRPASAVTKFCRLLKQSFSFNEAQKQALAVTVQRSRKLAEKFGVVGRQQQRRLDVAEETREVNEQFGYIGGDGTVHYNIPRQARRKIARRKAKV
jgi:hypothetical protein